jgi:Cu(I)/Ag(I) efflux system protein CusF
MKAFIAAVAILATAGPALAQAHHDMGAMDHGAKPSGAQGVGVIKKLDAKAGSVTLQHGPIPALGWPSMTMGFKADPALLTGVKVGQKVSFTVKPGAVPQILTLKPAS